jgi:serine/threonine protein phosphatase PrpC
MEGAPQGTIHQERPGSPIITESGPQEVCEYRTKSGVVAFVTERAGHPERLNEDAVVIDMENEGFAVVDGMGGQGNPVLATRIVAEELEKAFQTRSLLLDAHQSAQLRMKRENLHGGACYTAVQINGKYARIQQGGDTGIVLVNTVTGTSYTAVDEALDRNLFRSVGGRGSALTPQVTAHELKNNDRIYMASDGLWDNLDAEGVVSQTIGMSPRDAVLHLRLLAMEAMADRTNAMSKPDNLSIIVFDKLPKQS